MSDQPVRFISEDVAEWISESHTCCFCQKQYTGWGHNPEPLKHYPDRCCNDCDNSVVIPWRLQFGRDTEPLWLEYGLGKCASERVLCAHPFHKWNDEEPIGYTIDEDGPIEKGSAVYRVPELGSKAWYGHKANDDDDIGKAVEAVLGRAKTYYGGVPVK